MDSVLRIEKQKKKESITPKLNRQIERIKLQNSKKIGTNKSDK